MMKNSNKKWVKNGLFWTESVEEKARIRREGKHFLLASFILGVLSLGAYYALTSLDLQLVGIKVLGLFGIIAVVLFFIGIWELVTGNEPPSGI